jgi:hypothetical protein
LTVQKKYVLDNEVKTMVDSTNNLDIPIFDYYSANVENISEGYFVYFNDQEDKTHMAIRVKKIFDKT